MEVYNRKPLFDNKKVYDILNYLYENGPVSRMDIAKMLSLTKSAVTVITNSLILKGVLRETEEVHFPDVGLARGRRKIPLYINENYCPVMGMAVYNGKIYLGLSNLIGQTFAKSVTDISGEESYRKVLEKIVEAVNLILKENCLTLDSLLAFGICLDEKSGGFVGSITAKEALVRLSRDISHALPVRIAASGLFGGAMEAQYLFCKHDDRSDSFLLLSGLNGIRAGVMLNKRFYEGENGRAGDFFDKDYYNTVKKGTVKKLFSQIDLRAKLFDTFNVYSFGGIFEDAKVKKGIEQEWLYSEDKNFRIRPCVCGIDSLYLAGCAIAVGYYFYGKK